MAGERGLDVGTRAIRDQNRTPRRSCDPFVGLLVGDIEFDHSVSVLIGEGGRQGPASCQCQV